MSKKFSPKRFFASAFLSLLCPCLLIGNVYAKQNPVVNANTLCYNSPESNVVATESTDVTHKRVKRWLNGKPAVVNIIIVEGAGKMVVKPTYGEYKLNNVKRVSDFASRENAIAAVNASFFKPDIGAPLGISVIEREILTGPIYNRVVFGITETDEFIMGKPDVKGTIKIGKNLELKASNINQPLIGGNGYAIYTDRWGKTTPQTSQEYCHIVVKDNKIAYVKQSSVGIPENGYVLVGPRSLVTGRINANDEVSYSLKLTPDDWNDIKYAVGGGPYLVKEGKIFVDRQQFTNSFLWRKEPRTAIGYTKAGTLVMVTIDGRKKGVSEGATMSELAKIMWELGCYNAMNLDGGTSTQMVYKGRLVNSPTIAGGGKVVNALLVVPNDVTP